MSPQRISAQADLEKQAYHDTNSSEPELEDPNTTQNELDSTSMTQDAAPHNVAANCQYSTKLGLPTEDVRIAKWVDEMRKSDNGMCGGWNSQIDNLILFAGLFSATVTAFAVESYQWLAETPTDALARLQLRALLNTTGINDPAVNLLAPATFNVTLSSVAINTLWFTSLTLTLAGVIIGLLCKQWLYEYQRYDNFTPKEEFLVRGLRYRGLQEWSVPPIVTLLPLVLQLALVLFLMGLLLLLQPLQIIILSITSAIVGFTLIFLATTTLLPIFQYVFPRFETQCPYKSSQSLLPFWVLNRLKIRLGVPLAWLSIDRWEVTEICSGIGHTLSRAYELVSNDLDAVKGIYGFLADSSLQPRVESDQALLSDFVDGLDPSRSGDIKKSVSIDRTFFERHRRRTRLVTYDGSKNTTKLGPPIADGTYKVQIQETLARFLMQERGLYDSKLFYQFLEHWGQSFSDGLDGVEWWEGKLQDVFVYHATAEKDFKWGLGTAIRVIERCSSRLGNNDFELQTVPALSKVFLSIGRSHKLERIEPSPFTLLKYIQEWINLGIDHPPKPKLPKAKQLGWAKQSLDDERARTEPLLFRLAWPLKNDRPPSNYKYSRAMTTLLNMVLQGDLFGFDSNGERLYGHEDDYTQYLKPFAIFLQKFYERRDIKARHQEEGLLGREGLAIIDKYVAWNPSAHQPSH